MNPYIVLKKQITKLLTTEAALSAEERALFDWRFIIMQDGKPQVFGKTGANTLYYIDGDAEPKAMYPDEMLEYLTAQSKSKFTHYALYKRVGTKVRPVKKHIPTLEIAQKFKSSEVLVIYGIKPNGQKVKLMKTKQSLSGSVWVDA